MNKSYKNLFGIQCSCGLNDDNYIDKCDSKQCGISDHYHNLQLIKFQKMINDEREASAQLLSRRPDKCIMKRQPRRNGVAKSEILH